MPQAICAGTTSPKPKPRLRGNATAASILRAGVAAVLIAATCAPAQACRDTLADVVAPLFDAVVNVSTTLAPPVTDGVPLPRVPEGSPFSEFFEDFFGPDGSQDERVTSLGSGFVVDPSGLIVTNNHVIAEAGAIEVKFHNGDRLRVAEVVGIDRQTDLALLRVNSDVPLPAVRFAADDETNGGARVGDCVIAIGNPFGLGGTVTVGILSGKNRAINNGPFEEFLQTDASINKGNSGGPLFNLRGEVIGVNTAIISPTGRSVGIGFATPVSTVRTVIDQLRDKGVFIRGWIGVRVQSLTPMMARARGLGGETGAIIAGVQAGGPADEAGLRQGDIVTGWNGDDLADIRDFMKRVRRTTHGETVDLDVVRGSKRRNHQLTIAPAPDAQSTEDGTEALSMRAGTMPDEAPDPEDEGPPLIDAPRGLILEPLGLKVAALSPAVRRAFAIPNDVDNGLVVLDVAALQAAPEGTQEEGPPLKPGDLILEIGQRAVNSPGEAKLRLVEIRRSGGDSALLLVARPDGTIRYQSRGLSAE